MRIIINNGVRPPPDRSPTVNVHRLTLPPHAQSTRAAAPAAHEEHEDVLSSETLLKGRREILIRHGDKVYRLRHTSNDKLILTK
ncbi:hemin uptake protein HemP [Pseudoxanthomonas sp.]|uniref:hemin uptake protein HemP n=1 Tax=Pseudoxanthomonas sp. TaxID=1871049 RepID=UPI0031F33361